MSGFLDCNVKNYWIGAFGKYEVPDAIVSLANAANQRVKLLPADSSHWTRTPQCYGSWIKSPGFRVIEEWGNWRDAQEEAAWSKQA